jgi:hypothetical protein
LRVNWKYMHTNQMQFRINTQVMNLNCIFALLWGVWFKACLQHSKISWGVRFVAHLEFSKFKACAPQNLPGSEVKLNNETTNLKRNLTWPSFWKFKQVECPLHRLKMNMNHLRLLENQTIMLVHGDWLMKFTWPNNRSEIEKSSTRKATSLFQKRLISLTLLSYWASSINSALLYCFKFSAYLVLFSIYQRVHSRK